VKAPKKQVKTKKPQRKLQELVASYQASRSLFQDHYHPSPVWYLREDPAHFFKTYMTQCDRSVFSYIAAKQVEHKGNVFMSQATIADSLGICERQAVKSIRRLRAWGLTDHSYKHFHTCRNYRIAKIFMTPNVAAALAEYVPQLLLLVKLPYRQYINHFLRSFFNGNKYVNVEELWSINRCRKWWDLTDEEYWELGLTKPEDSWLIAHDKPPPPRKQRFLSEKEKNLRNAVGIKTIIEKYPLFREDNTLTPRYNPGGRHGPR